MPPLKYQNTDIQKLSQDLIAAFAGITPGTGVNIIGLDIDPGLEVIEDDEFTLDVPTTSVTISVTGEESALINGKSVPSGYSFTWARGLDKPYPAGKFVIDASNTVVIINYNEVVTEEE